MTFFQRAAGAAAAFLFAASAQPAAASEASASPGIESLEEVVERAIEASAAAPAPAAAETPVPAPAPAERRPLELLVAEHAAGAARDTQADCLAAAVYFESNGEPFAGQLAVAEVIINRARSGRFADTLCGVITQRSQFSFVRGGRIPSPPRHTQAWRNAVAIAHIALDDMADSPVSDALFFHARYVSPGWRLRRLATVGNHIFYR